MYEYKNYYFSGRLRNIFIFFVPSSLSCEIRVVPKYCIKYMLKFSVFGPILIQIGCQFINVSNPFFKTCLAQKLISFSFKLQICFYSSMQLVKKIVKSVACWLFTTKIRNKVKLKNILLGFNLLINLIHKSRRDAKSIVDQECQTQKTD